MTKAKGGGKSSEAKKSMTGTEVARMDAEKRKMQEAKQALAAEAERERKALLRAHATNMAKEVFDDLLSAAWVVCAAHDRERARLQAEADAKLMAEENARLAAEHEAAMIAAERRAQERAAEHRRQHAAAEEARRVAEEEARLVAEEHALRRAERQDAAAFAREIARQEAARRVNNYRRVYQQRRQEMVSPSIYEQNGVRGHIPIKASVPQYMAVAPGKRETPGRTYKYTPGAVRVASIPPAGTRASRFASPPTVSRRPSRANASGSRHPASAPASAALRTRAESAGGTLALRADRQRLSRAARPPPPDRAANMYPYATHLQLCDAAVDDVLRVATLAGDAAAASGVASSAESFALQVDGVSAAGLSAQGTDGGESTLALSQYAKESSALSVTESRHSLAGSESGHELGAFSRSPARQ